MQRMTHYFCWIWLATLASVVHGQDSAPPAPPAAAPVEVAPRPWLPEGPFGPSAGVVPEVVQPAPATQPLGPPPLPALPQWGNYADPLAVPVALPPVEYTLAGPPRGWFQQFGGSDYRSVVADPAAVPDIDLRLTQPIDLNRPDAFAPSGVNGAVTLPTGRLMVTYGYQQQNLVGAYVGTHRVSNAAVGATYALIPTRGLSDAQSATIGYGVTDDLTINASLPWAHNDIDFTSLGGGNVHSSFSEPGDAQISALYVLRRAYRQQHHLNFGMSVPVGMLYAQSKFGTPTLITPTYPLRTSSGTYDLLPGYTYRGQTDNWSWGVQIRGVVRLGFNTLGYKLGDRLDSTGWVARRWTERVSTSARIESQIWGNFGGLDSNLNPTQTPTNNPLAQGGRRIDLLFGINVYLPATRIPGQYLTVESGLPVYQSLDGPQLGVNWLLNASWNMVW